MLNAEILSVGTELLLGDIVNTDAAYISGRLAMLGISVYRQSTVGDNAERMTEALKEALGRAELVIMTGGLGPTCDDITKKTVADLFGLRLLKDKTAENDIKRYFDDIGRRMTENNLLQALVPEGARVIRNSHGTAPGIIVRGRVPGISGERTVIMLPGPPHELMPMFDEAVAPYLSELTDRVFYSVNLHLYGIGESAAETYLREIMESSVNPTVAPYACEAEVRIRITASGKDRDDCVRKCRETVELIRKTPAGEYIFAESTSNENASEVLVRRVIDMLRSRSMTIGTAESCTAGMISSKIADIPGSSDVLAGGIVSYSNIVKEKVLGVNSETLETVGAVSEKCASEMAQGARRIIGCDIAISVTGIAGPGGGSSEKPVGTVCFGISDANGTVTDTMYFGAGSDRGRVRRMTVSAALMKIAKRLNG